MSTWMWFKSCKKCIKNGKSTFLQMLIKSQKSAKLLALMNWMDYNFQRNEWHVFSVFLLISLNYLRESWKYLKNWANTKEFSKTDKLKESVKWRWLYLTTKIEKYVKNVNGQQN